MAYTRQQTVELALKYLGAVRGSRKHRDLIDTFNRVRPHGQHMTYTWAWCAATVTAIRIKAGYTMANSPMSYSCAQLIKDQKALEKKGKGKWIENDAWRYAEPGDLIIYYWNAKKTGEQKSGTSHVGMIVKRTSTGYEVIEGNCHNKVKMRTVPFDWRYIRGFCHLYYEEEKPIGELKVDGVFGKRSIKRAQQYFKTPADGLISGQNRLYRSYYKGIDENCIRYGDGGSKLVRAIQKMVGVKQTGVLKKSTVIALQHYLGIVEDGKWGKATSKAFQRWLNGKL